MKSQAIKEIVNRTETLQQHFDRMRGLVSKLNEYHVLGARGEGYDHWLEGIDEARMNMKVVLEEIEFSVDDAIDEVRVVRRKAAGFL